MQILILLTAMQSLRPEMEKMEIGLVGFCLKENEKGV